MKYLSSDNTNSKIFKDIQSSEITDLINTIKAAVGAMTLDTSTIDATYNATNKTIQFDLKNISSSKISDITSVIQSTASAMFLDSSTIDFVYNSTNKTFQANLLNIPSSLITNFSNDVEDVVGSMIQSTESVNLSFYNRILSAKTNFRTFEFDGTFTPMMSFVVYEINDNKTFHVKGFFTTYNDLGKLFDFTIIIKGYKQNGVIHILDFYLENQNGTPPSNIAQLILSNNSSDLIFDYVSGGANYNFKARFDIIENIIDDNYFVPSQYPYNNLSVYLGLNYTDFQEVNLLTDINANTLVNFSGSICDIGDIPLGATLDIPLTSGMNRLKINGVIYARADGNIDARSDLTSSHDGKVKIKDTNDIKIGFSLTSALDGELIKMVFTR